MCSRPAGRRARVLQMARQLQVRGLEFCKWRDRCRSDYAPVRVANLVLVQDGQLAACQALR